MSVLSVCACARALALQPDLQGRVATARQIIVTDVKPVVAERPPFQLVESFVAVNPVNPSNLLISAMSVSANEAVLYASWDGGASWKEVRDDAGLPFRGGDPMVAFDGNGRAYLSTIAPGFSTWRSEDGGRSWLGPVGVGSGSRYDDRQWLTVSRDPGSEPLPLYGAAKTRDSESERLQDVIFTTVSRDGGRTFSAPARIAPDSGYLQYVSYLLARESGTVLMPYVINYARLPDGRYRGGIWIRASEDGVVYSAPRFVADYLSYGDGAAGDRRWKGLGATPMAEDRSRGRYAGTVYMTWAAPIDDWLQIVVARSRDGGRTWSEPARANRGGLTSNHSSPAVAVGHDGVVAVSWNDRRDAPRDDCSRPYVALSFDGGESFALEQRITNAATCPGAGSRWMNGGETHGLAALPAGSFRLVWTSGSAGDLRLWTAVLRAE